MDSVRTNRAPLLLNDRFKITSDLNEGCSSKVYAATDLALSKPVAIKIFKETGSEFSRQKRLFMMQNETLILKRLKHKNIQVYFASGSNGQLTWDDQPDSKEIIFLISECPTK